MNPTPHSPANQVLELAIRALDERHTVYGDVTTAFTKAAALWSVILSQRIDPWQVALCLDALKTTRIINDPMHLDSWIDKCGYTALGAQLAGAVTNQPHGEDHRCTSTTSSYNGKVFRCYMRQGHDGHHLSGPRPPYDHRWEASGE